MTNSLIGGLLIVLGLVIGPGLLVTILWSPILIASRFRSLFRRLSLTGSVLVNYVISCFVLSLPWLYGVRIALTFDPARVRVIGMLAVGYLIGLPLIAGFGLPRLGVDWDPTGYGFTTWSLLVLSSTWFSLILTIPLLIIALFRMCSWQCLW